MWSENYRPTVLANLLGHEPVVDRLRAFVREPAKMPNLIFTGPAGIGKTSSAHALGREILQDTFLENFLEVNASDARRMEDFREYIKSFVLSSPFGEAPFRILLFDEADDLGKDFQSALRRTMEKSPHIRFIYILNVGGTLIPAIESR